MLKRVLVTLLACAFATGVFAQAQPAQPKAQAGTETHKAAPAKKQAKASKKTKKSETKSEAKK